MATTNDLQTLNGLFKEVFAKKIEQLIPDGVKLFKMIDFVARDKQGGSKYVQPVIVQQEHGLTYGSSDDDAFNLNPPVSGNIKRAEVKGNPKVMRSFLGYTAASRAIVSQGAFEDELKYVIANMLRSLHKRLEIETLYGQDDLGEVSSVAANVLTMTQASWASGMWAGGEGMPLEIRSSAGVLRGQANIASVDISNRQLTLDAMPVGVVAGDRLFFKGAYGKEFAGFKKIITNSGSLFGIDASQYSLWKGNTYPSGGALSIEKILLALSLAISKGLDSDVHCLVNPDIFATLVADEAALRRYGADYNPKKAENGFGQLTFFGQSGAIMVEPSIYVKQGDAFLVDLKQFVRIGSSDVTLKRPGSDEDYFRDLSDAAAYEIRAWCDLALFTPAPGKAVYISGITV